jgi:hypothetical protein
MKMRDLKGGHAAVGGTLREAFRPGAVAPIPPEMAVLIDRIDAADAKRREGAGHGR